MKVLVRQPKTGLYYQGFYRWVEDPDKAMTFKDSLQAFDFCVNQTTCEAEILLCTADHADDVVITPEHSNEPAAMTMV